MIGLEKSKRTFFKRTSGSLFVFLAWTTNAVLRIYFAYQLLVGVQLLDVRVSQYVEQVMFLMFLSLGVAGLVTSAGLYLKTGWSIVGTVAVSVATIVFDVWGMTIQFTAALGFIAPVMAAGYLLATERPILVSRNGNRVDVSVTDGGV